MAYICGMLTKAERATLEARGWDIEDCPDELIDVAGDVDPEDYAMVWVDASMLEIMSGPDWEK